MDQSFSYMFNDRHWPRKMFIGGLFLLLSIVPVAAIGVLWFARPQVLLSWIWPALIIALTGLSLTWGYAIEVLQNVQRNGSSELPEWNNLFQKLKKGIVVLIIAVFYMMPVILLVLGTLVRMDTTKIPERIYVTILDFLSYFAAMDVFILIVGFPAIMVRYAETERLISAFEWGPIVALVGGHVRDYAAALLGTWVAALIGLSGLLLCGVGIFFTTFWTYLVAAHLWGQVERQALSTAV